MGSRRILGFALGEHHDAGLAYGALAMAVAVRGGAVPGVIMHTDQGSEDRRGQSGRSPRRPGRGRRLRWPVRPAAEDMQVRTSGTNRVRQAARAGCRGTPARLGRYRSPGCSTSTCQPAGSDVSTRKTNLGYIRRTIKPAFGSTQVRKVRGPLSEYAGTLGVISPSHCSRSPHGAGEGVRSARGLFRSW